MPVCTVCSGTTFSCQDGYFFCAECDTQSQDFVDEQASELMADSVFTTKRLRKTKGKKVLDKGLPWHCAEGFQLIIKAHVKALITLGADPSINDVMQQIWFKYVHKTGLAVMDKNQVAESRKNMHFRDFFMTHFRQEVLPTKSSKEVKIRLSRGHRSKSLSDSNLPSTKSGHNEKGLCNDEEWFSVDTGLSTTDISDTEASSSKLKKSIFDTYTPTLRGSWMSIGIMTCLKVISLCYISLHWCREPVTAGDLIHWIETGQLPYFGAIDCLLPHMKVTEADHQLFDSRYLPRHDQIVIMSEALIRYLDITDLPEVDIMLLVIRYLQQLNLPSSLAALANSLFLKLDIKRKLLKTAKATPKISRQYFARLQNSYCPDIVAVSLIAVVLKLLFVLDDDTEWKVDSEGECCLHVENSKESPDLCHVFTWKNWTRQILLQHEHTEKNDYNLFEKFDPIFVGDVHKCMENYLSIVTRGPTKAKTKEKSQTKQFVFKRLAEKQGSGSEKQKRAEKRVSKASCYKLFGRGIESSSDLTPACVSILMNKMKSRNGVGYIKYDALTSAMKDPSSFHQSYMFLLRVLSDLTYADVMDIHSYVMYVESNTVQPYLQT